VRQRRDGPRFPFEPGLALRIGARGTGQDLERHVAAKPRVARAIDFAHAAGGNRGDHFVGADTESGGELHATGLLSSFECLGLQCACHSELTRRRSNCARTHTHTQTHTVCVPARPHDVSLASVCSSSFRQVKGRRRLRLRASSRGRAGRSRACWRASRPRPWDVRSCRSCR
jgi:hypothetical protein